MKQATKKELAKHAKRGDKELGHFENKHWCNCLTRGYRKYLGVKLYGSEDIKNSYLQYLEK